MEFDRRVAALDADALENAAAALLALLTGTETKFRSAARQSGRESGRKNGGADAETLPAGGGETERIYSDTMARDEIRPAAATAGDAPRQRPPGSSSEEAALLSAAEPPTAGSAAGSGGDAGNASEAARVSKALAALPGSGGDAEDAAMRNGAPSFPAAAEADAASSDAAEAISEFFRRDSRRYDSGFGE